MKRNPRQVAQTLASSNMTLEGSYFTSVEIAYPGFMNFRLGESGSATRWPSSSPRGEAGDNDSTRWVRSTWSGSVSANPTGPMHMGNARGGVLGDTPGIRAAKSGADVWREFYVNDAYNQIEKFAKSLEAWYFQIIKGEDAVEFPEGRLPRRRHPRTGAGVLKKRARSIWTAMKRPATMRWRSSVPSVNIPKMKSDLPSTTVFSTTSGSSPASRERLQGRHRGVR